MDKMLLHQYPWSESSQTILLFRSVGTQTEDYNLRRLGFALGIWRAWYIYLFAFWTQTNKLRNPEIARQQMWWLGDGGFGATP
jgi:hypothetical protein